MKYKVTWETDGETVQLPKIVDVPSAVDDDDVAEYLSEEYGWLVNTLEPYKDVVLQLSGNNLLIAQHAFRLEVKYLEDKIKKAKFDYQATTYRMQLNRVHDMLKALD